MSESFLISHKMSVLLNVIILTCKEASIDVAEGGCQHWALFSKSNQKKKKKQKREITHNQGQ